VPTMFCPPLPYCEVLPLPPPSLGHFGASNVCMFWGSSGGPLLGQTPRCPALRPAPADAAHSQLTREFGEACRVLPLPQPVSLCVLPLVSCRWRS
jgi:hypothetical protein